MCDYEECGFDIEEVLSGQHFAATQDAEARLSDDGKEFFEMIQASSDVKEIDLDEVAAAEM